MELLLKRTELSEKSTIGELYVDGVFECFTLEDKVRARKIPKETAISAGRYEVVINHSDRFDKLLPLLLYVPNFSGVRIHSGNKPDDTEGCILVGNTKSVDFVGESRIAFSALFKKMQAVAKKEKIFIEIVDKT